ncbi:hypothetical protein OEZ85_008695 [Tetradesmus obliquus]|uniref:RecA family profile 1 domain-containing protein n=1 Tax=Tetradesmus obliquus TaxID=3088 RepID=A0ABY8TLJ5_TETOB|nr:hypothetical protein OEZ85_008695 [Tetradesmus obliquus]
MPRIKTEELPDGTADPIKAHLRSYGSVECYLTSTQDYLPAAFWAQNQQSIQGQDVTRAAHAALMQQLQQQAPAAVSGAALMALIEFTRMLPFGVDGLDAILMGGMRETTITELAGESCSGKTQLCLLAAVTTAHRGERVVYFDTTNAFSAGRARQLCMANYNDTACLGNIMVVACHSIHALLASLDELAAQASSSDPGARPSMIIVDSISALLSPVIGSTQHHQGHVLVAETGRLLRHIADSLKLAVLVTNHVVGSSYGGYGSRAAPGRDSTATTGQQGGAATGAARLGPGDVNYNFKPALGEQWRGLPHTRLQLSRTPAADSVCATLLASSIKDLGHQAWFSIGETIQDAERPG